MAISTGAVVHGGLPGLISAVLRNPFTHCGKQCEGDGH
jgi:hypothetical protein